MGYIFLMSIAGSALFVGYLCWEKILGKSVTQCVKYRALMIVMLVYSVPWIWIKGIYRTIIELFWPGEIATEARGLINVADIETKELAYHTKEYRLLTLGMMIWFAIAVILLIIRTGKFVVKSQRFHALAIKCGDKNLEQTLKRLKEKGWYGRSPEIVWTRVDNETFTLGTIKPVIVLQKEYAEGDLYWILKHEMMHIVRMDLWVKRLLEFVCCLHWFNPLIYILNRKLRYLCETACDESVIRGCTEEECQTYISLLDRNKKSSRIRLPFGSALEGGSKEINQRIALMRDRKRIGGGERVLAICTFGLLVFLDSLTSLVYPDVHHVKNAVIEAAKDSIDGGNFWTYDFAEEGYDIPIESILYDEQFVDSTGEIYPMDSVSEDSSCLQHDIVSGIVQIHKKSDDGSCTIETYEGTRCKECGTIWKGEYLHKMRTTFCPHELLSEE